MRNVCTLSFLFVNASHEILLIGIGTMFASSSAQKEQGGPSKAKKAKPLVNHTIPKAWKLKLTKELRAYKVFG